MKTKKTMLKTADLCKQIGRDPAFWSRARMLKMGPKFIRIGKIYSYDIKDVRAWLKTDTGRHFFDGVKI